MLRLIMQASTLLATAFLALPAQAQTLTDGPRYWHYGWDWGWGHMVFGSLMMVLFWGGIILVTVLAVRWLDGTSREPVRIESGKTALRFLQERFARGEIEKGEFEERKRLLYD